MLKYYVQNLHEQQCHTSMTAEKFNCSLKQSYYQIYSSCISLLAAKFTDICLTKCLVRFVHICKYDMVKTEKYLSNSEVVLKICLLLVFFLIGWA